jgi:hypothetical protein
VSVVGPVGPARTLSEMRDDRADGLMVGTTDDGGVGMCRLINGEPEWRENFTPDEAEAIGKELVRLAKKQRSAAGAMRRKRKG